MVVEDVEELVDEVDVLEVELEEVEEVELELEVEDVEVVVGQPEFTWKLSKVISNEFVCELD